MFGSCLSSQWRCSKDDSVSNIVILLVLLLFGYLVPMVYVVRIIYLGLFAPSMLHNLSATLGL